MTGSAWKPSERKLRKLQDSCIARQLSQDWTDLLGKDSSFPAHHSTHLTIGDPCMQQSKRGHSHSALCQLIKQSRGDSWRNATSSLLDALQDLWWVWVEALAGTAAGTRMGLHVSQSAVLRLWIPSVSVLSSDS